VRAAGAGQVVIPSADLPHRRYSDTLRGQPSTRGSPSTYDL
jgi:hypothetical protein